MTNDAIPKYIKVVLKGAGEYAIKIFNGVKIKPVKMPALITIKLYNLISFSNGKTVDKTYKQKCLTIKNATTPAKQTKNVIPGLNPKLA
jgi:hypothetical protein